SSAWQAMQDLAPIATASGASGFFAIAAPSNDVAAPLWRKACGCGCGFASASVRMSVRGNIRSKSWVVNALAGNALACGSPPLVFAAVCAVIAGNMRLKSCSVSALEVVAGWAACATAGRTARRAAATASSVSNAMAVRRPLLRTVRSEEAMFGARKIPADLCDGVMRMQAFLMLDAHMEAGDAIVRFECAPEAPRRVFTKHRVFGVGNGEGLLVFALYRRLHRGAEGSFGSIDQGDQIDRRIRNEAHAHMRDTALCVRGGGHAAFAAQPLEHGGMAQLLPCAEIRREPLLDDLPRQREGSGAGRGIHDSRPEAQVEHIADQDGFDGNRVGAPAVVFAAQCLAARQMFEADADARAIREVVVRLQESAQQRFQHFCIDGRALEVLVRQQVQTRHVDAASIRMHQVDESVDIRARALGVA